MKMIKDLISVIVPCFNVEKWLPDCFKSLDNQTYRNFEVIFINDGSKDATLKCLQDYCAKNKNAHLINQNNAGLSNARNEGVKIAQGEYVYFYDADDILFPNTLQDFHRLITEYDCDCAIANFKRVPADFKFEDLTEEKIKDKKPTIVEGGRDKVLEFYFKKDIIDSYVWLKLYKMDILKKFDTFPKVYDEKIKYCEDILFNLEYYKQTSKIVKMDTILYCYRRNPESLTRNEFYENKLSAYVGMDQCYEYCEKNYPQFVKYVARLRFKNLSLGFLNQMYHADYKNTEQIAKVYSYIKKDSKFLKEKFLLINVAVLKWKLNKSLRKSNLKIKEEI